MTVAEFLEALCQRDTQSNMADEASAARMNTAFLSSIRKASDWHSKVVRTPGADRLALVCAASGEALCHRSVKKLYARMALAGDSKAVGAMSVADFAAAVEHEAATDRADKIIIKSVPDEVNSCANYIKAQKKLISEGKRPNATKKQLIAEHLGDDDTGAMEKALLPSRYGKLLGV